MRPTLKRAATALGTVAAGTSLALLPSSAWAADLEGFTYQECYTAYGWYEWTQDGTLGGKPNFDTTGDVTVSVTDPPGCSWIDSGVLQYSGYQYRSGAWQQIEWKNLPSYSWGGDLYDLTFQNVRDLQFRVCNVQNGKESGCGRVV